MKNGKGKRDRLIRELREQGYSVRAIGRRVGLSGMQVSRILDSLAAGDPAVTLTALGDVTELHAAYIAPEMIAADPDIWRRCNPVERYRFQFIAGGFAVPAHDPDHELCCLARRGWSTKLDPPATTTLSGTRGWAPSPTPTGEASAGRPQENLRQLPQLPHSTL